VVAAEFMVNSRSAAWTGGVRPTCGLDCAPEELNARNWTQFQCFGYNYCMHDDKYLKSYGLSRDQGEVLRALFQAGCASTEPPSWLRSPARRTACAALVRAGLLSEPGRLTLAGLAVAASLPALGRCRWRDAA